MVSRPISAHKSLGWRLWAQTSIRAYLSFARRVFTSWLALCMDLVGRPIARVVIAVSRDFPSEAGSEGGPLVVIWSGTDAAVGARPRKAS